MKRKYTDFVTGVSAKYYLSEELHFLKKYISPKTSSTPQISDTNSNVENNCPNKIASPQYVEDQNFCFKGNENNVEILSDLDENSCMDGSDNNIERIYGHDENEDMYVMEVVGSIEIDVIDLIIIDKIFVNEFMYDENNEDFNNLEKKKLVFEEIQGLIYRKSKEVISGNNKSINFFIFF